MQTQTEKNGRSRTKKQDQQDLDRAEGEGMAQPAFSLDNKDDNSVLHLLNMRSWREIADRIEDQVLAYPLASVGAALCVGIGLGLLLRFRR